jgi:hypothetical protein
VRWDRDSGEELGDEELAGRRARAAEAQSAGETLGERT